MTIKFYDTSSLLVKAHNLFEDEEEVIISSITLNELEKIKNSSNKDPEVKYAARIVLKKLEEHFNNYKIINFKESYLKDFYDFEITNDIKILACAFWYKKTYNVENICFITNDLALKHIARIYFDNNVESVKDVDDFYAGYKEVYLDDQQLIDFYQELNKNHFNLLTNEYIIIYNEDEEMVDSLCWTGETHRKLSYGNFDSTAFGKVKPYKGDIYQTLAADSLINNKITIVEGPAGSGKTYLSIGYLLYKLERHQIDKIIVFCNTVATKNSAKLGFYPGTKDEKLLDSQIGNLLSSKLGGRIAVEQMINNEELVLLPMSDIRGYDTTGMRAGIYISEAQNLDIDLMKLALQRIGNDSICIIDGDCHTQVDDIAFAGSRNGMKRVSKVFRGHNIYGEIYLKNIHRSKIAEIAELM